MASTAAACASVMASMRSVPAGCAAVRRVMSRKPRALVLRADCLQDGNAPRRYRPAGLLARRQLRACFPYLRGDGAGAGGLGEGQRLVRQRESVVAAPLRDGD